MATQGQGESTLAMNTRDVTGSETSSTVEERAPTAKWILPQRLENMAFIGKDILAVADDVYIMFLNFRNKTELVYVANDAEKGDGVDVIAGHKTNMFAFAEKVKDSRLFIMMYPSFQILAELKDKDVNRYKGLCMMEGDLVMGFGGFPKYEMSVWSWRSGQRLISLPTGVVRRRQMYMASRTHTLACQCWGGGLIVWEVAPCYKRCFVMKRMKPEAQGWEISDPPLVSICWAADGSLYAIDSKAYLYGIVSDGINMVSNLEWNEEFEGTAVPCMCSFGTGLLIYCPDRQLRWLKKAETKWLVSWQWRPDDEIQRLVSNALSDTAVVWTEDGQVMRLIPDDTRVDLRIVAFKQRHITRMLLIAPDYEFVATLSEKGVICIYELSTSQLVQVQSVAASDVTMEASPTEPLLAVVGEVPASGKPDGNYGIAIFYLEREETITLRRTDSNCLTYQYVTRIVFSPTGRELVAAAMSAGHLFIFKISDEHKLTLVRYCEIGRGLADCFLMKVGETMRAFSLVLFSDKYAIGERIVCINADNGKDNKFAGKMQGPYCSLLPLSTKDTMLAIPNLSRQFHVLKLNGDKGVTVSVKMGPIFDSSHELRQFYGFRSVQALLTYGADGQVIYRHAHAPPEYEWRLCTSHRFDGGVKQVAIDSRGLWLAAQGSRGTVMFAARNVPTPRPEPPSQNLFVDDNKLTIIHVDEKNYLDIQEEKKVREEALDYKRQREEVVKAFEVLQGKLVELLEENIAEIPLHQLSLSEFNLHLENKKDRLRQAEREREEIRLNTEALIKAQDKVTAWIKKTCWDTMLTSRIKLLAIFSHYQVENYPTLPTQRDLWPELQQVEALRTIEMESDDDLFRPWDENFDPDQLKGPKWSAIVSTTTAGRLSNTSAGMVATLSMTSKIGAVSMQDDKVEEDHDEKLDALSTYASSASRFITVPPTAVPQPRTFSFLQMYYMQHIVKLNVQNMRLWFNKQFDELMVQKKREVGLVEERNSRLRFIIEELNKLSDLRGSFHHLMNVIVDPPWAQEEQPYKLIKVEPEECEIPPYISPSQIVVIPPDPGPKDDFRERALIEMMDGVLEKLWHEEIKKPIPMPQCMLDKDPEHFNEEDLRQVFDYEAKVAFRNEERNKYRKMLHAEYAKLSQILNEGVVKFNHKVKEMWLTKLQVDSVIGQENLSLMRLRRTNLDRVEASEELEDMRSSTARLEREMEELTREQLLINEQSGECQMAYDALAQKDRQMERTFKNHFADLSPVVVDQCYRFFKRRPKWHQRVTMSPAVLYELAGGILTGIKPPLLHPDCLDYFKAVEQLDDVKNMPAVLDDVLWATMCRLRRMKIESEIRMRGVALEAGYVEAAMGTWTRALAARRMALATTAQRIVIHREKLLENALNRTVQLVLPAGQVEIITTGHIEDFEDATLIPREDIEKINNLILKVGAMKLSMMRKQMEFRKGILAKEWEHAQMKMKLRHMKQELYSYQRLKIPKELQFYLKKKEEGYTDDMDYQRLEREMEANKMSFNRILADNIHQVQELEVRVSRAQAAKDGLERIRASLNVRVSEKKLKEDPLEPIRVRRLLKKRMESLVWRSRLVRDVQANHTKLVLLQTELELLRLKTYPTLATFRTFC